MEKALALTTADFDFKNMELTVNKGITFDVNKQSDEDDTKSNYFVKKIPIPDFARGLFREYISGLGPFTYLQN